ncbi:T9SS type A sorting domain-containing protein [Hymenobacter sp. BT18]|uniref:CARDB domain-containing protein n=1 Tax=Hymenobacter sp. BT18 TaxID=2835648 RepID=UPI00143E5B24|nr:CARDB domain-containing protein [Hymenobacter sp. BT18]QIX61065.1 T9SS type A sorting domain-containing protein [Hymenobacter sp. BT18]
MMKLYRLFTCPKWAALSVLLLACTWFSSTATAQNYNIPASGTASITTCEGTLYDDGGANGNYTAYANGVITINPGTSGSKIKLEFSSVSTYYYDEITIYDGNSTSGAVIGTFTNSANPGTVYATNSTGALTVRFATSYYSYSGFAASISCVTTVPKPDLAVQGASVQPLSVVAGNNVYVTSSIYNLTGTTATSSSVGYYLSADSKLDDSDILVGNSTGSSLAVGSSSYREASVQIPATTTTGSYYMLFVGDYLNSVAESNEENNIASVSLNVIPASVDLVMLQASVSPISTAPGNAISLTSYIKNNGNTASSSSSIGYYLSSDNKLDGNDQLLTSTYGSSLYAGYSNYANAYTNIPTSVTPGSYYVLFAADYQGLVEESNEDNNVTAVAITVAKASIDLVPTQSQISTSTTTAGTTISAATYIYNQGNTTAGTSSVGFYLSTDNKLDSKDVLLNSVTGSSLAANVSSYRGAYLTIPATTASGTYYLLIAADYQDKVTESNETNNVASLTLKIEDPYVDLNVQYPSLGTTSVASGSSVSVSAYVYNLGNSTASASKVGFYLSKNTSLDGNDVLLQSSSVSGISAGNYAYPYTTVQIPSTTAAGSYYILFVADYENSLSESNEQNNVASYALTVITPGIDLSIYSASLSRTSVAAGGSVTSSFYVYNSGNTYSASSNAQVYLSKDVTLDNNDELLTTSTGGYLSAYDYSYRSFSTTIPSTTTPGAYYVLLVADATNAVSETNEQNNTTAISFTVAEPFNGTVVPTSGKTSVTTCGTKIYDNGGTENYASYTSGTLTIYPSTAGAKVQLDFTQFSLNYYSYLYIYDGPDTSSPLLGSYTYYNVAPGTLKATNSTGAITVVFSTDYYVSTGFEATVSCIGATENPDLALSAATLGSTSINAGSSLSASVKVTNSGKASASASTVGYYLSTDNVFSTSDVPLATTTGASLAAGASATRSATLAIPSGTAAGSYYVLFVADPSEQVTETNETNNVTSVSLKVTRPQPNLELASATLSAASGLPGAALTSSVTIKNTGTASATASTVGYYLSKDAVYDAADVSMGQTTGGTLAASGSATRTGSFSIPAATTAGSYYVLFVADAQGTIMESNETDNVLSVALTVKATQADLTLASATLGSSTVVTGNTVTTSVSIKNQGSASAASSTIGYYLSANTTWDGNDVLLKTVTGASLAAAASDTRTNSLTIPATTAAGSYYVLFVADPQSSVTEGDETNNVASASLAVTAPAVADLSLASATLQAATVVKGSTVSSSVQISNSGNAAASASTVGYYLSKNTTLDATDVSLGQTTGGALGANASATRTATLTIPAATVAGGYYVLFVADAQSAVTESNETNNVATVALAVTDPVVTLMPDLTFLASSTTLSASAGAAGSSLTVSSTFTNAGTGSASSTPFAVYLSADENFDAADISLGGAAGTTLASGASSQQQLTVTVPATTTAGNYYLLVVLNPDNTVAESSTTNNLARVAFTVTVATAQQEQTAGLTIGVYPNPASAGYFRVSLQGATASAEEATLTLFNSIGQRLEQRTLPGRTGVATFSTRELSQGVYLLHITGNNLHVVKRVVVE